MDDCLYQMLDLIGYIRTIQIKNLETDGQWQWGLY